MLSQAKAWHPSGAGSYNRVVRGPERKEQVMERTMSLAAAALAAWIGLAATGCAGEPASPPPAEKPSAPAPEQPTAPAPAPAPDAASLAQNREQAIARGIAYLVSQQAEDGSWAKGNIGISALCTQALLAGGKTIQDPTVRKAVDFLAKQQTEDGGIHDVGLENYTTSIALMVLVKADPKTYASHIEKAKAYLIAHQWDEAESIDTGHPWYGGAGYGQHERPDLSNEAFFLEAMHQAGVPKDHPLWKKAQVFLSRTQDRSESNDGVFVGTDSGGFVYSPHGGGESKAETVDLPNGKKGLKAYGSMTYAGFKSFIYAGLTRDDPRVLAALDWIRRHWTFDENPELGQQGLFYYYMTAARALAAWGEPAIMDARRRTHDWRAELSDSILRRQRENGSWFNEAERWFEGEQVPVVPTSYCILALVECRQPATSGASAE
jgi:squalene-hopene/tetraprenyl-beta-curcumene cyclase